MLVVFTDAIAVGEAAWFGNGRESWNRRLAHWEIARRDDKYAALLARRRVIRSPIVGVSNKASAKPCSAQKTPPSRLRGQ
jgi:hypothetical protein